MGSRNPFVFFVRQRLSNPANFGDVKVTSREFEFRRSGKLYVDKVYVGKWEWRDGTMYLERKLTSQNDVKQFQPLFNSEELRSRLAHEYSMWLVKQALK